MSIDFNPKAYRERSVPRPLEEGRKAIDAFYDDVKAAAQKHGIADVTVGAIVNVTLPPRDLLDGDEQEVPIQGVMHIGDFSKAVECASYSHAYLRAEFDEYMLRVKATAEKSARRGK